MRMRKRHNLEPRMEKCADLMINEPENMKGRWKTDFPRFGHIQLEIGCGKGRFTADTAEAMPDTLIIAIEKVPDAMIIAMERVKERGLENVRFIDGDAAKLKEMFENGELERVYINFCDPWPGKKHAKRRLTHGNFLKLYRKVLAENAQIHFKTDNQPLFEFSAEEIPQFGFTLSEVTRNLHENGPVGVMTDYEAKFYAEGLKINRLRAIKNKDTKTTAHGEVPRLHNSALRDARGYEESKAANNEENR